MTDIAQSWSGWHETVEAVRSDPRQARLARDHYLDLPRLPAAKRFARSLEFALVVRDIIGTGPGKLLDLNAGHGLASVGFAEAKWSVTAVEPDPSTDVGAGAIRELAAESGLKIEAMVADASALPVPDGVMDVVFGRGALQRAGDLDAALAEAYRVLRPGGKAMFTREPVVDDADQLAAFRRCQLLDRCGAVNAYPRARYEDAMRAAGFHVRRVWGPLEWHTNYYPGAELRRRGIVLRTMVLRPDAWLRGRRRFRRRLEAVARRDVRQRSWRYTFLAVKPNGEHHGSPGHLWSANGRAAPDRHAANGRAAANGHSSNGRAAPPA